MRNENNEKQENKTNENVPNIMEEDTIHDQSYLDDQHNTEIIPEDLPADYQKCILPSFSCYLEEADAFNRHLTNLAQHTAR